MPDDGMTMARRQSPTLRHPDRFYIDGEWTKADSDSSFDVVNPSDETLLYQVASASESDVHRAVDGARRAFDHGPWPRLSHAERAGFLCRIADAIDRRAPELAAIQRARWALSIYRRWRDAERMPGNLPRVRRDG